MEHADSGRGGGWCARAKKRIDATTHILLEYGVDCTREKVAKVYWDSQQKFENVRIRGLDTAFDVQLDDFLDSIEPGLSKSLVAEGKERVSERHLHAFLEHPPALMAGYWRLSPRSPMKGTRSG